MQPILRAPACTKECVVVRSYLNYGDEITCTDKSMVLLLLVDTKNTDTNRLFTSEISENSLPACFMAGAILLRDVTSFPQNDWDYFPSYMFK